VSHGLRHAFANDLYEKMTGAPSPVRGATHKPPQDKPARQGIARSLGHGRQRVSSMYLGSSLALRPAKASEPATPAQPGVTG